MMPRFASQAEYYRHHREVLQRAMARGVTPATIERELAEARARDRRCDAQLRRERRAAIAQESHPEARSYSDWDAPYMMRN